MPVYLDSYPLHAVLDVRRRAAARRSSASCSSCSGAGKLDRVRMLLLTNCTFDGITYDPERVMREVLAIKPDMIFLWDEAWFALRARSAPRCAGAPPWTRRRGSRELPLAGVPRALRRLAGAFDGEPATSDLADAAPMPDPDRVRVRVYATQSTHKTLTVAAPGLDDPRATTRTSSRRPRDAFHEAYMTHTSTSPNYQILASLDVGRRQVELEGYELVAAQRSGWP